MSAILRKYVDAFRGARDLDGDDAELFLDALITEHDESLLADVFRAWSMKDIASDEIFQIARIMRDRCTKIRAKYDRFVDIVGTGGSRSKTFNVSTAAAFVVAGAGVTVAKHGNRAATSNSGSADVLSELGVEPAVDPATAERCLNEIGICFMFAPNFHRLSPTLAKVRRGLGFPTIFNCVGPLCNPAAAPHQLIGVWSEEMVGKMADALARLGTKKSWVVHGRDGLDEISIAEKTIVAEVEDGSVRTFEMNAEDFGVPSRSLDGLRVESARESAEVIRRVLTGESAGETSEQIIGINAAGALLLAGDADDLADGFQRALESIRSCRAGNKLEELAQFVR